MIKINEKLIQSEQNQSIKCFNCKKTKYIAKNCYLTKREKLFTDTANKRDSRSFHKVYDFT